VAIVKQDESIFHANAAQKFVWAEPGTQNGFIKKSEGQGIMTSDFMCEAGLLQLSDAQLVFAKYVSK